MRSLLLVSAIVAATASAVMFGAPMPNRDEPVAQWQFPYFGGDFEPLVIPSINKLFVPVNFQEEGSAIFAINLDNGFTNYTLTLNNGKTQHVWGPGPHSYDATTGYLYVTNSSSWICLDANTGEKIWVTNAPAGTTDLGLGQVAVVGNGYVYYSAQGYYNTEGIPQVTVLDATTGKIALTESLWNGTVVNQCKDDPANQMGPRPLYDNINNTIAKRLLFACGGCLLGTVDIHDATNPKEAWISPVDNCNTTQVPRGGYTVSNVFDELVYQWNGNNLTALNSRTGKVQWDYKADGAIINAPAVDASGNVFVAHINKTGSLILKKLNGVRQVPMWQWNHTAANATVVDYHVVYDYGADQVYVSLTTSTPGMASKGTSYMCGINGRTGAKGWCVTVANPARGTPKSSRISLEGPWVVLASSVTEEGTPFSSGTVSAYKHTAGTTPAPEGGIILKNCSGGTACTKGCKTQYPSTGCNAGAAPGSSVLYFCEGGNTLLYAQYFDNSTTCSGLPSSAKEYGVGICFPSDNKQDSIIVTHC